MKAHVEFEDGNGDPCGYSYVQKSDRSLCYSYDGEALRQFYESKPQGNRTEKTVYEDNEGEDEVFEDDESAVGEQRRARRWCINICIFTLGLVTVFVSMKISNIKAANMITPCPTVAPIITQSPTLSSVPSTSPTRPTIIHPVCSVCSGEKDEEGIDQFAMTKPDEFAFDSADNLIGAMSIAANNASIFMGSTNVTCTNLHTAGLDGFIDQNSCSYLQSQAFIKDRCGCTAVVDDEAVDVREVCFICGSEDATISNPDAVPSLSTFLGQQEESTCFDLDYMGRSGTIGPSDCAVLQSQTQILKQCGCSNIEEPPKPSFPICSICGSQRLQNPLAKE